MSPAQTVFWYWCKVSFIPAAQQSYQSPCYKFIIHSAPLLSCQKIWADQDLKLTLPTWQKKFKKIQISITKNNPKRNPFPIVLDNQTIARPDLICTTYYTSFQHQHLVTNDFNQTKKTSTKSRHRPQMQKDIKWKKLLEDWKTQWKKQFWLESQIWLYFS